MLIHEQLQHFPLSPAEKGVANFLLAFPEKLETSSIQTIAQNTYTQPSTVVRMAKKLGFSGWTDFKRAYLKEWQYSQKGLADLDANHPFGPKDNIMTIAQKMATLEEATIADTLSLLNHDSLANAKSLLSQASTIAIFAYNANLLIAQDFALKMRRLGKTVILSDIPGEERYLAHNLDANSCAILISYSGENDNLLGINRILQDRGIPTLAITSIGNNQLAKSCTSFLPLTTREKLYSKIGSFSSNTSIILLLNILYAVLFAQDYDGHYQHLKATGRQIDFRKASHSALEEQEVSSD
ncbi:MurR/RpiR family transcriptional regulator [Streptococcus rifensis]